MNDKVPQVALQALGVRTDIIFEYVLCTLLNHNKMYYAVFSVMLK